MHNKLPLSLSLSLTRVPDSEGTAAVFWDSGQKLPKCILGKFGVISSVHDKTLA